MFNTREGSKIGWGKKDMGHTKTNSQMADVNPKISTIKLNVMD